MFSPKKLLVVFVVILVFASLFLGYIIGRKAPAPASNLNNSKPRPAAVDTGSPASAGSIDLTPGAVGEINVKDEITGADKPLVTPVLPLDIFSTTGVVLEIKSDYFTITSDGFSFADSQPRTIKCLVSPQTKIIISNPPASFYGQEGLESLQAGAKVLIDSRDNIRGKTEFTVNTVNIIE